MKRLAARIFLLLACLTLGLAIARPAVAQTPTPPTKQVITGDQIVIGETYRLTSGQSLIGNLLIIGGSATIDQSSEVRGDVLLLGGILNISGSINGEIVAVGGIANLSATSYVKGDVTVIGASVTREPGSLLSGRWISQLPEGYKLNLNTLRGSFLPQTRDLADRFSMSIFRGLALAALAMLAALLLPKPTKRIVDHLCDQPVINGGIGLLTILAGASGIAILAITLILIPVSLGVTLALVVTSLFGWIAVGVLVGEGLAKLFKSQWDLAISAGIGTLVMSLTASWIGLISCIGWVVSAMIIFVGLGAVVSSRFGAAPRQKLPVYPPVAPPASLPPAGENPA